MKEKWRRSTLSTLSDFSIYAKIKKLVLDYKLKSKSKEDSLPIKDYKIKLNELFDISSKCPSNVEEDLLFLEDQRSERASSVGSIDLDTSKNLNQKFKRQISKELRKEKSRLKLDDSFISSERANE